MTREVHGDGTSVVRFRLKDVCGDKQRYQGTGYCTVKLLAPVLLQAGRTQVIL